MSVRALVLRTAGTNCEAETIRALELSGARTDLLHLFAVLADPARFDAYEILVLPGGFSYGDYVSAGRVWGAELRHGLRESLSALVARGGLLLGVCNGFQVLVETGLLDGSFDGAKARDVALYGNASNHYECRWVTLQSEASACPWIVPGERWPCPVAHGEGRFVVRDAAVLERLAANGQIALRYASEGGGDPAYPECPNGAVGAIAGICDPTGRVLGIMPHPERNITPWQHPFWTRLAPRSEGEGLAFYRRMVEVARSGAPTLHAAGSASSGGSDGTSRAT